MTEKSFPWAGRVIGDASNAPYTDTNWSNIFAHNYNNWDDPTNLTLARYYSDTGTIGNDIPLQVTPISSQRRVNVSDGFASCGGRTYFNDATVEIELSQNASGNDRYDLIVLEVDWSAQTIRLDVVEGTPSASPVEPTLTFNFGFTAQYKVARILVQNGYTEITTSDIHHSIDSGEARLVRDKDTITGEMKTITVADPLTYTPPNGWILADGSAITESEYPGLYTITGGALPIPANGHLVLLESGQFDTSVAQHDFDLTGYLFSDYKLVIKTKGILGSANPASYLHWIISGSDVTGGANYGDFYTYILHTGTSGGAYGSASSNASYMAAYTTYDTATVHIGGSVHEYSFYNMKGFDNYKAPTHMGSGMVALDISGNGSSLDSYGWYSSEQAGDSGDAETLSILSWTGLNSGVSVNFIEYIEYEFYGVNNSVGSEVTIIKT